MDLKRITWQRLVFLDYSLEDYKRCTQAGLKVGVNIQGVYVSAGVQGGSCNGLLNEMGGEVSLFIARALFDLKIGPRRNMWRQSVSLQRTRRAAAWWRTLSLSLRVAVVNPSLLCWLKSFPPRSWWICGATACVLTLTSSAERWVCLSFVTPQHLFVISPRMSF